MNMKIKLERSSYQNNLSLRDEVNFIPNKKTIVSITIYDLPLRSQEKFETVEIDEIIKKRKNYIEVSNGQETKYIILSSGSTKKKKSEFKILDYDIIIYSDKVELNNFDFLTENLNNFYSELINFVTQKGLSVEFIDVKLLIKDNVILKFCFKIERLQEYLEEFKNFIISVLNNSNISNLLEVDIHRTYVGTGDFVIEIDFEKNFCIDKEKLKFLQLLNGKSIERIGLYIDKSTKNTITKINYKIVDSEIIANNIDLLKEMFEFKESKLYDFLMEIRDLSFLNNSDKLQKFLILFENLKQNLKEIDKVFELIYL